MHARFAKDYVVVMIDQDRMKDGKQVAEELRKGKRGGIPWMVIVDGDGQQVITSDGPKGNVGCPAREHEIDYFMTMVDKTRRHMSDDDRAILERDLRAYGAELTRPRTKEPGYGEYAVAAKKVQFGLFQDAVAELGKSLAAGHAAESVFADAALRPLREDPDRRPELFELIEKHVKTNRIQLVDPREPGRRIRLEGRVVAMETGKPLAGALVQLFHTDAKGEYRPGMDAGGGAGNPRLSGFLRTDAEGRFTVDTIMPERYPNSSVPRHVHYKVRAEGYPELVSECFFDSDPNLTERTRKSAPSRNFPIVELERDAELRQVGKLQIRVPSK